MSIRKTFNSERGISLIEVVMAVTLLLIVVTALIRLGITTLNTSDASRARSIAQQFAEESMDYLRFIRDTSPSVFFNLSSPRTDGISIPNGFYEWNPVGTQVTEADLDLTTCRPGQPGTIGTSCDITTTLSGAQVTFYRIIDIEGTNTSREVTIYIYWNNSGTYSNLKTGTILTRWKS